LKIGLVDSAEALDQSPEQRRRETPNPDRRKKLVVECFDVGSHVDTGRNMPTIEWAHLKPPAD
jgi:hypothetical protein